MPPSPGATKTARTQGFHRTETRTELKTTYTRTNAAYKWLSVAKTPTAHGAKRDDSCSSLEPLHGSRYLQGLMRASVSRRPQPSTHFGRQLADNVAQVSRDLPALRGCAASQGLQRH